MPARHVAGDRQTETDPAGRRVARRLEPHERTKHPVAVGRWNPGPVIVNQDVDAVVARRRRQPDMAAVAPRVADRD